MGAYDFIMKPAFAGMKADSGLDRVESYSAETAVPFGAVVTLGTKTDQVKLGGTKGVGIAVHSHTVVKQYEKFDTVSVMTKGLVWAQVKDSETCTDRGEVKFDPATGLVSDNGSATLDKAVFRSASVNAGEYGYIALVELN